MPFTSGMDIYIEGTITAVGSDEHIKCIDLYPDNLSWEKIFNAAETGRINASNGDLFFNTVLIPKDKEDLVRGQSNWIETEKRISL